MKLYTPLVGLLVVLLSSHLPIFAQISNNPIPCGRAYRSALYHYYKLDYRAPNNSVAKDIMENNDGVFIGNPVTVADRFDHKNAATYLNGQGSTRQHMYINRAIPSNSLAANNFTISIRFKTESSTAGKIINFGNKKTGQSEHRDRQIYINGTGTLYFNLNWTGGSGGDSPYHVKADDKSYNDGEWYMVTATLNSTDGMKLYVNGVLKGHNPTPKGGQKYGNSKNEDGYWRVGFDKVGLQNNNPGLNLPSNDDLKFDGAVDDFMVFDRALSNSEVGLLYGDILEAGSSGVTCIGNTVTLNAPDIPGATYQWTIGRGITQNNSTLRNPSFVLTPDYIGEYSVVVKKDGCERRYTFHYQPYENTGIASWVGLNSKLWDDATNWCSGSLPTNSNVSVEIPDSTSVNFSPTVNLSSVSVKKILLKEKGSLVVNATRKITLDNLEMLPKSKLVLLGELEFGNGITKPSTAEIDAQNGKLTFKKSFSFTRDLFTNNRVKDITVDGSSVQVSINNNASVELSGVLNVVNGGTFASNNNLVLMPDASVASMTAASKITGKVTVKSFVKGGVENPFRTYRIFSSPVYDHTNSFITSGERTFKLSELKKYMLLTGRQPQINGFDESQQNSPSIWTYSNSTFRNVENLNSATIAAGNGVYVYYRGNRENSNGRKFNPPYADVEDNVIEYSGILNQQDVNVDVSAVSNNSYILLGNPYASVIDFTKVNLTGIEKVMWIYNPALRRYGVFQSTNNGNGNSNPIQLNGATKYVNTGQGFFVKKTNTNASITFKESAKVNVPSDGFAVQSTTEMPFLMMTMPHNKSSSIRIKLKSLTTYDSDEIVMVFADGENEKYDENDVEHWANDRLNISSLSSDGEKLSINMLPSVSQLSEVPLWINAATSGNYLMHFDALSFSSMYKVSLKDHYTGLTYQLIADKAHQFTIDINNTLTHGDKRFSLLFEKNEVLPLKLERFVANANSEMINVVWKFLDQEGVKSYVLQKSVDGKVFKTIALHNIASNMSYSYQDKDALVGTNYYKLLCVNNEGVEKEIGLTSVNFGVNHNTIKVYPNPVQNELNISLQGLKPGNYKFEIVDVLGEIQQVGNLNVSRDLNHTHINTTGLAKGVFFLRIKNALNDGVISTTRLLKK